MNCPRYTNEPSEDDVMAWMDQMGQGVNCPQCGVVQHQPISEDEQHCPCTLTDPRPNLWSSEMCECACHGARWARSA